MVSSRPSDAIALAARTDAPIFVAPQVLDDSGVEIQDEEVRSRVREITWALVGEGEPLL